MVGTPIDLAGLFEHLPNAFMVVDAELRYVAANAAYLRATGAVLEQILGVHVFSAFPDDPDDPNSASVRRLRASFERVLATGRADEVAAIRYRVPRSPGGPLEDRIWSARHSPLLGADGAVAYVIQETAEITHLTEVAVDESSTHLPALVLERAVRVEAVATSLDAQLRDLRQMFAQAPGFMCFLRSRDHVFEIVNAAYMQLIGHRQVVGMAVRDALPEVVDQGFCALLDSVFDSGDAFIGHHQPIQLQRRPGGALEECFVDFVYQPIRDDAGRVVGIFVQGQDVTVEHRAEERERGLRVAAEAARHDLELAEARQRFLIEAIPVQVWTATPDGSLDFISRRVVDYFQAPSEDLLGAGWLSRIHADDLDECGARWAQALRTGAPYEVEFRLRRGDGVYRWHLGRALAETADDGAIGRWFGSNTDIHDAKLAVAELRARVEYEQRLIGIVSHDLRNPLSSIGLAASLLTDRGQLDPDDQKIVDRLSRSSDRASRLITDLLDFAKARFDSSIPINPRPTNLREIVEQVVDELRVTDRSRILRVGHAGAEDGRWDADRIAQVISNLVGNALQHSPPGAPITVESRVDDNDAMFAVSNDGPPIPAPELAALFEPFKRGGNAAAGGGSVGLGLYIAREVVIAHGGSIEVESQPGAGTRFMVRLPRFVAPTVAVP